MLQFTIASVRTGADAKTKEDAIQQVSQLLVENGNIEPGYSFSMMEREKLSTTYLGKGVAIPHGLPIDRTLILKTGVAVLQFPNGVEWQPNNIAHLVIGIAAKSDEHLEVLAKLTYLLNRDDLVEMLANTPDANRIVEALLDSVPDAPPSVEPSSVNAVSTEAVVGPVHGLHARPAMSFAAQARAFQSAIQVSLGSKRVDGKSVASLLQLGAKHGERVRILADGADAPRALAELKARIEAAEVEEPRRAAAAHTWKPVRAGARITGVGASPGLAIGRIQLFESQKVEISHAMGGVADEKAIFRAALAAAHESLDTLYEQVKMRTSEDAAQIFRAQDELLRDAALLQLVENRIDTGQSAAYSWSQEIEKLADSLAKSGNEVTAGRAADVHDIGARVLGNLRRGENTAAGIQPTEPVLLVARDLTPSQTAGFDPARIAGFCTADGSATSHVAILARSLNLVAMAGAGEELLHLQEGQLGILDGDRGILYLDPTPADLESARAQQQILAGSRACTYDCRFEPAFTRDDVRIEVCGNIARADEATKAIEAGGEGVGLLRTEFLFLHRSGAPTEDEQFEAYREMLERLDGLPLVLRTLDVGGDKNVPYINLPHEENPFLGVRGIRLCLRHPEIFRPQLRAAYRASVHGNLKLMFPMISTVGEMVAARRIAEEVRQELGVAPVPIGAMIEVPSAVAMADELAREADFFSIGTNDLTQYVLAMDRGNSLLAREAQGTHPAVLRSIARTVEAAAKYGKPVAVCGGLAGDPVGAAILVGLGVHELSVAIPSIPAVKASIRGLLHGEAQALARRALTSEDAEAVRAIYQGAEERKSA